jgi:hypothetical protein
MAGGRPAAGADSAGGHLGLAPGGGPIVTLMVSGGDRAESLARDTGVVGLSILTAALRDRVASFREREAAGPGDGEPEDEDLHGPPPTPKEALQSLGLASIGLTIPAIAIASIWLDGPLVLGLGATQIGLLVLTALVSCLTLLPGRATLQEGGVHLIILAAFLFLAFNP